jgi:hypothetical protein
LKEDRMKQLFLSEICKPWSIERDSLRQRRCRDAWDGSGMLLRSRSIRCICCEGLLASVWVPFSRGSSGLLHGDGEDVTQKMVAREGREGKHGISAAFDRLRLLLCCLLVQKLSNPANGSS